MLTHAPILCRILVLWSLFTTIPIVLADNKNSLHIRHVVPSSSISEGVWLNHHAGIDPSVKLHQSPIPSTYNESEAIYLAYLTSVAYCQARHIQNWSCSPCVLVQPLENVSVVEDTKDNFQGIVGYSRQNNAVIVAFRGSMDIPNWIDNLTFFKTAPYRQFPNVHVHEGFYWVYQSVASEVIAAVRTLRTLHPSARVTITGHSLGGAVAALCGFHLSLIENIPVHHLYTFGEPRVGDSSFSTLIQKGIPHTYRITHYHDVVPHLPQTWLGFKHSVQEVYYDAYASTYQVCDPNNGEDPLCSDVCSPFGCRSVVDHLTYVNVTMSHLIC